MKIDLNTGYQRSFGAITREGSFSPIIIEKRRATPLLTRDKEKELFIKLHNP